jgi:hypothetical protein
VRVGLAQSGFRTMNKVKYITSTYYDINITFKVVVGRKFGDDPIWISLLK